MVVWIAFLHDHDANYENILCVCSTEERAKELGAEILRRDWAVNEEKIERDLAVYPKEVQ
jgi:hypothetical protein